MNNLSKNNIVDLTNRFEITPKLSDVKQYVNSLVKFEKEFKTLNSDWLINLKITSRAKKHIVYSNKWHELSRVEKERHNQYIFYLEKIINNAEYLGENKNTKDDIKSNIKKYHYFRTFVKIKEYKYEIIIDTEQYITESEEKPQSVHLYNIHEINKTSIR